MPDLTAGTALSPELVLTRPLEESRGNVWFAAYAKDGAPKTEAMEVVVKFLPPELVTSPEARVRFTREARTGSKVESPHVVKRLDFGVTDDGVPYIAMERLIGEDLRSRLGRDGALAPAIVVELVGQIAEALTSVHAAGIVHRDVKPENVFLCEREGDDPLVKLLDFGVAKVVKQKSSVATSAGVVVGTPNYMSPEQMTGGQIDEQVDLWALAVVAFESLTGHRPFPGETIEQIGLAALVAPRPKIGKVDKIFAPLDPFFERAFHKERKHRFADASELAASFAKMVDALSDPTIPSSAARTRSIETFALTVQPQRRARVVLIVVALLLAAAAVVGYFVTKGS